MSEQQHQQPQVPVEVVLSVLTVPVLGGLIGARSLQQSLIDLGEASEELFRGDRLPILHFQQQKELTSSSH
ncbi:MAG: hypothetical protein BRC33_08935 [Cyanobacteria bacterium SW_9_44_58]|nr:MAG: hypothetical protein BRC33_08935 [Cyanobacteria bacterium SW_9_44_58]